MQYRDWNDSFTSVVELRRGDDGHVRQWCVQRADTLLLGY